VETTRPLTTTELSVLGLLAFGEASGYELARGAERSIGYMWAPSRSHIYKVLPRLVELGCATCREVTQQGRPDKAVYRITRHGRAVLRAWVDDVDPDPDGGNAVFLMKIFFGFVAGPDSALRQLDAYRAVVERHLSEFEAMERALPPEEPVHSRIALLHGIARARAALDWADAARVLLERERERERELAGAAARAAR